MSLKEFQRSQLKTLEMLERARNWLLAPDLARELRISEGAARHRLARVARNGWARRERVPEGFAYVLTERGAKRLAWLKERRGKPGLFDGLFGGE